MEKVRFAIIQTMILLLLYPQAFTSECFDSSKKREIEQCCNFPKPIPNSNVPECAKKYQSLMSDHQNHVICLTDCHFSGLGFLKKDKIDLKAFRNVTKAELGPMQPEAQDAISRLGEMCVRILRDQASAIAKAGTKCGATAFAFLKCLGDGVFANCPDKYWSTREICTKYDKGVPFCDKKNN